MKKRLLSVTALLIAGVTAVAFAGCSLFDTPSADGTSPSIVAEGNGTADSREEFLADQQNPSGYRKLYEEAVADGYTGSYVDFLKEIGSSMIDGSAGVNMALNSVVGIECEFTEYTTSLDGRPIMSTQTVYTAGAGVIYSMSAEDKAAGNAYIVTNFHVVYDAQSTGRESVTHISDNIDIYLYGSSETIDATYVGGAINYDIAVLRVQGSDILRDSAAVEASVADSDSITVGESVYAIGNPEGEGISSVAGVVSVDAEYINITAADEKSSLSLLEIRIDAAINHGNSGGGLFNASGDLVGIVNARSEADGVEGFGYAIPSNLAIAVAHNIQDNAAAGSSDKGATRATLGVTVQVAKSESVYDPVTCKTYIEETVVVQGSSGIAAEMGLSNGDTFISATITRSDGVVVQQKAVTRMHIITTMMFNVRLGDTVEFVVSRGGEQKTLSYTFSSASDFTLFGANVVS